MAPEQYATDVPSRPSYGDPIARAYENVPQPMTPEVTVLLHDLSEAGHRLAATAENLLSAREQHSEASMRYASLADQVAKAREASGT